jgi:ribose transport system ATP-binding protein
MMGTDAPHGHLSNEGTGMNVTSTNPSVDSAGQDETPSGSAATAAMLDGRPMKLSVTGLTKTFQGQRALDEVGLELRAGEIHCLLGQNGSGKSTLIKVLAGYHSPEAGAALVDGQDLELGSAAAAHSRGLRFIHQDLALIDTLSVYDNLALGNDYTGRFWLSESREKRHAKKIFTKYGVAIDAGAELGQLGAASRTMTAIVRALHHGDATNGILVLDEPTASLSEVEKDHLFAMLRDVKAQGGTMLYVTHRLHEVFELADRVTVLRDGRSVGTREVAELNHDSLVEMILGRSVDSFYPEPPTPGKDAVLEVSGLAGGNVTEFSGSVMANEIVGIVGLDGSGAGDIPQLIFGATPRTAGEIRLDGKSCNPRAPWDAIKKGFAFVPGDRKRLGGVSDWTLRENLTLPKILGKGPLRWLAPKWEGKEVASLLERLEVKPNDTEAGFSSLSGGNQQKIVIARWLRCGARAYLMDEPTAGVDVGAKSAIYKALREVAAGGAGVLMTTSDLEEACAVCDRVYVVHEGRVAAELRGAALTVDNLLGEMLRPAISSKENTINA